MGAFDHIVETAKHKGKRIVLTESEDARVIEAANLAAEMDLCKVILLTNGNELAGKITAAAKSNVEILDITQKTATRERYIDLLVELRSAKGMTRELAEKEVGNKLVYAMLMMRSGDADGVVSGAITHTADVLRPAFQIVGTKPGIKKVSSVFIMESPSAEYGDNGFLIFADCGVNPNPTDEELAEIAVLSSQSAVTLCGMNPRVALLSYSTKSGDEMKDENVNKIKRAYNLARELAPDLVIDGEIQADAAIRPEVAQLKCPGSVLGGRANVLVFPDLNAGNINYKLVQRLAGVQAVGPILQGLRMPVNDLSRGTTTDEIVLCMAITSLQSNS